MTLEQYASLSYEEKLHFPACEYRRMVEADHAAYKKSMNRIKLANAWTHRVIYVLFAATMVVAVFVAADVLHAL